MMYKTKRLLITTILLTVLLLSIAYGSFMPKAQAAQPTLQEKGLSLLGNVFHLNIADCNSTVTEGAQDEYMGVVPENNIRYTLEANGSKVDTLCTFVNGNLRMMYILENQGTPVITKLATKQFAFGNMTLKVIDTLETAKSFLNNYQSYTRKSFYQDLSSMMNEIDVSKNMTEIIGNIRFTVNASGDSTDFRWTYTCNGMDAPDKCVALGYTNGFLKYFIDNWNLYTIGSTDINLSEKEATDIALNSARASSWTMSGENCTVQIRNFNVTSAMIWENQFASSLYADKARDGGYFTLYPMRHVWVSLDKYYPGNVYGIEVYIWADTKDVAYVKERFSTLDPPPNSFADSNDYTVEPVSGKELNNDQKLESIAFPAFVATSLGLIPLWLLISRKRNLAKPHKIGGILLCLLVSSTIILAPISMVSGTDPDRGALVFGSRSDSAMTGGPYSYHWRKTGDQEPYSGELYRQGVTSNAISNYFRADGYDAENLQGYPGSIKANVLDKVQDTADQHSLAAVVYFDHGVGNVRSGNFHYQVEDDNGTYVGAPPMQFPNRTENGIYDYEIQQRTDNYSPSKYFFALINTCLSGKYDEWTYTDQQTSIEYPVGQGLGNGVQSMPFAWTNRLVDSGLSSDGYNYPDNDVFCYIGFPYGSAALDQTITGISPIYATWLENFFWYALSYDISVNDALDEATLRNYNCLFGDSDLATSFTANWPVDWNGDGYFEPQNGYNSRMAVYGNGNMHLYQYFVQDYIEATSSGWSAGVNNPHGIEGGSNDDSFTTLYANGWYGDQAVITGYVPNSPIGHIYLYGDTDAGYASHVEVWVSYYEASGWYPVNTNLWITQTSPGWIDVGEYQGFFNYIAIVAYFDSQPSLLNVDSVLVIPEPNEFSEHYWVQSLVSSTAYGSGYIDNPDGIEHSYIDYDYAEIYGYDYYDDGGVIVGEMNKEAHGQIYFYGYSIDTYWSHYYVYVSDDNYNWVQTHEDDLYWVGEGWVDGGYSPTDFKYIAIVGVHEGMPVKLFIDSVRVFS